MTLDVVLVHGFQGHPECFDAMKAALETAGHVVHAPQLPSQENVANAQFLASYVTPFPSYALVGYSLGGLSTRYLMKFMSARPSQYVSLDAPQHGIWWASFLPWDQGGEAGSWSPFIGLHAEAPAEFDARLEECFELALNEVSVWSTPTLPAWATVACCPARRASTLTQTTAPSRPTLT